MTTNEVYDWVEKRMAVQWADWLCCGNDPTNPLLSPIFADLRGLPPIYILAGGVEILVDMIKSFADCAKEQGANVHLEVWQNMPQTSGLLETRHQRVKKHFSVLASR